MLLFAPFIAIGVLVIVDILLARAWAPVYFRYGIPLFRLRVLGVRLDAAAEERLATVTERNVSRIFFKRLSESEIAFRENGHSSVTFRYTPVLHGLIRYVPDEGATYVIGWINWFALAAVAFMVYLFFDSFRRPWDLTIWFTLIFGLFFGIGIFRYRMVAKALRSRP